MTPQSTPSNKEGNDKQLKQTDFNEYLDVNSYMTLTYYIYYFFRLNIIKIWIVTLE